MYRTIVVLFFMLTTLGLSASAQSAAPVYNDYNATTKGITIGTSKCVAWSHTTAPWGAEVACYTNNVFVKGELKTVGEALFGWFPVGGNIICWFIKPGATGLDFQLSGQAAGGTPILKKGTF